MADLYFKVRADWEEVLRLRQELEALRGEMSKIDSSSAEGASALEELSKRYGDVNARLNEMVDTAARAASEVGSANTWIKKLESFGDVSEETREKVEQLVNGLNSWTEAAGRAFNAGDEKGMERAQVMVEALTKELEKIADDAAPAAEDAFDDMADAEEEVSEATETLTDALQGLGKKGLKGILDLPIPEREGKYSQILKDAGINVGALTKKLGPLKSSILQVGDAVVQTLMKTPGGPAKLIAAVATAVTSLAVVAIKKLISKMQEAREASRELREISQKEIDTFAVERAELDRLTKKLSKAKEGSEEYQNTKNEIVSKFGKYDDALKTEALTVDYLRKNYDKLAIAIQQSARERAFLASSEAITERYKKNFENSLDTIFSLYQKKTERAGNEDTAAAFQNQYDRINYMIDAGNTVEEIMNEVSGFSELQRERIERSLKTVVKGQAKMKDEIEKSRKRLGIRDTSSLYKAIDNQSSGTGPTTPTTQKGGRVEEIVPEGSLADLKKRLSELNEELLKEVDMDARVTIQKSIDIIEGQIDAMEYRIKSMAKDLPPIQSENLPEILGRATSDMKPKLAGSRPSQKRPDDNTFLGTNWAEQLQVIDKASDALRDFGKAVGGVTGDVITLASDTVTAFTSMAGGVKVLEKGVKGLEKASAIFAIISAAVKVLTAVVNIVKKNKEANEAAAKAADEYKRALEGVVDQTRLLAEKNAFGQDTYGQFKAYAEQAQAAKKAFEDLGDTQKKIVSDARSGWQKFWGMGKNQETVWLSEFYDELGNLDVEKLSAWYDTYGDHLTKENQRLVEGMIAEWERYEDAVEGMTDYLSSLFGDTAASIADLMIDSFKESGNALADLARVADEFGENMAKSIVTSMLLDNIFTPEKQKEVQSMLLAGNTSGAVNFYNDLLDDALEMAPRITEFLQGIGLEQDNITEKGTAGSFQGMSQQMGASLEGRFTALQISNEGIRQGVDYIASTMADMIRRQTEGVTISDEIRRIQADSYLALLRIQENTGDIIKPIRTMQGDIEIIRQNTQRL